MAGAPYSSRKSGKKAAITLASSAGTGRSTAEVIRDIGFSEPQGTRLSQLFGEVTPATAERLLRTIADRASSDRAFEMVVFAIDLRNRLDEREASMTRKQHRSVPLSSVATAAKQLGIPQVAVRALLESVGGVEKKGPTEAQIEQWLSEAAEDKTAFASKVAAARNAHEQAKLAIAAKRLAEAERLRKEEAEAVAIRLQLGLDTKVRHPGEVWTADMAKVLGISQAQVRGAITKGYLSASLIEYQGMHGWTQAYVVPIRNLVAVTAADPAPEWLQKCRQRASRLSAARHEAAAKRAEKLRVEREHREAVAAAAAAMVKVRLPVRRGRLAHAEAHLGPTNSGKTHAGIAMLAAAGEGVYAAPLRMMAAEAADRLRATLGSECVGLVTGEEEENPDAPVLCCTAECAPLQTKLMVLDEVHWVADPERGWAWARLLAGAEVERMVVAGAPESEGLLVKALGDDLVVHHHERLGPIMYVGDVSVEDLEPRTIVVAFSRKAVLALARDITNSGRPTGVLYGAMPPAARRETIARFVSGESEVLVSTDVIGHGINLPADTVLMAETSKYDGKSRRPLYLWEAAQIVGRAGRFGLSQSGGNAGVYADARLSSDAVLVSNAVEVASGGTWSDLRVQRGELRPTLGDMGCDRARDIPLHLKAWQTKASSALSEHGWLRSRPVGPLVERVEMIVGRSLKLSADDVWQLAMLPVDDIVRLQQYASCLESGSVIRLPSVDKVERSPLDRAEAVASEARDAMVLQRAFADRITFTSPPVDVERAASRRIIELLPATIKTNRFGKCHSCGRPCPPWFSECDSCHRSSWWENEYDS